MGMMFRKIDVFFSYKLKLVRKPNAMGEDQNIQFKENLVPWLPEILEKS